MMTVSSGAAAGYVVTMLLTPLLTRIYTPHDFGMLAIYMSIVAMITVCATLGLEQAIPVVVPEKDARALVAVALCSTLFTAIVTFIVFYFLNRITTQFKAIETIKSFHWIIAIGVLGGGFHLILSTWGIKQRSYHQISRARFIQTTGQIFLQIILGFIKVVPEGIILGDGLGRLLGSSSFLKLDNIWKDFFVKSKIWVTYFAVAWTNKRFCSLCLSYNILNIVGQHVGLLGISLFLPPWELGIFALSSRLTMIPTAFVGKAASQVFLGETAHSVRERPGSFYIHFLAAIKKLNIIGLVIASGIMLLSPLLVRRLLGEQWSMVGWIMAIRAPVAWIQLVGVPATGGLIILRRQDLQLFMEGGRIAFMIAMIGLGSALQWGLLTVSVIYSLIEITYYAILIILNLYISRVNHG